MEGHNTALCAAFTSPYHYGNDPNSDFMSWRDVADDRRASIKTLRAYNDRACPKCEDLLERSEKATAALEDARDSVGSIADDPHANHRESLIHVRNQIDKAITQLDFDADVSDSDHSNMDDSDMDDSDMDDDVANDDVVIRIAS